MLALVSLITGKQEGLWQNTQLEKLFGTKTRIHPMATGLLPLLRSSFV